MEERNLQRSRILNSLQEEKTQEAIRRLIQRAHEEARIPIGWAAEFFAFTEARLREWDRSGLLRSIRSNESASGKRQYPLAELDKLAIIRALIDCGFNANDILPDIDEIWQEITSNHRRQISEGSDSLDDWESFSSSAARSGEPIDNFIVDVYRHELFWRYYVPFVLRQALTLACDEIPYPAVGLVLPLHQFAPHIPLANPADLQGLGESLVAWRGESQTFYTFLRSAPTFDVPSDYRIHPLQEMDDGEPVGDMPQDNIYLIVTRRTRPFSIGAEVVQVARALLTGIYQQRDKWLVSFRETASGHTRDFSSPGLGSDRGVLSPSFFLLDKLAQTLIALGGKTAEGRDRWRFCSIMLPRSDLLSYQQRSLVAQGRSKHSPYTVGVKTFAPTERHISVRAFLSGRIVYRPRIARDDSSAALRELEGPVRSAIAIPVAGADHQSIALVYIASYEYDAFSLLDQRILRLVSGLVKEFITLYTDWQPAVDKLAPLIAHPEIVDTLFRDFPSENDFVRDIEQTLDDITKQARGIAILHLPSAPQPAPEVLTLISLDVDDRSRFAERYGDVVMRNLGREVGQRTGRFLQSRCNDEDYKLYYIYADRFYIVLKNIRLEEAREMAEELRHVLRGAYQIQSLRVSFEDALFPRGVLEIPNVTVRLGVASYMRDNLQELINNYGGGVNVRGTMIRALDRALTLAREDGGDCVWAWSPEKQKDPASLFFERWSPKERM